MSLFYSCAKCENTLKCQSICRIGELFHSQMNIIPCHEPKSPKAWSPECAEVFRQTAKFLKFSVRSRQSWGIYLEGASLTKVKGNAVSKWKVIVFFSEIEMATCSSTNKMQISQSEFHIYSDIFYFWNSYPLCIIQWVIVWKICWYIII